MKLETQQNEAMRREIGYRLGVLLSQELESTPEHLLQLIRQLRDLDDGAVEDPGALLEQMDDWLRVLFVQQGQDLRERLSHEPNRNKRDELERLLSKIDETLHGELEKPAPK